MKNEAMNNRETREQEPIRTNWVVITGPPSSGKTTTLKDLMEKLQAQNYSQVEEQARKLIEEDKKRGVQRFGDRTYEINLNNRVLSERERIEASLPKDSSILMDRGTPDVVSYMRYYDQNEQAAIEASKKFRYAKVFYLEPLVSNEQDVTREENPEFAKWMHENLPKVYEELGYEIVRVPVFPYSERTYESEEEKRKDSLGQRSKFIMEKISEGLRPLRASGPEGGGRE